VRWAAPAKAVDGGARAVPAAAALLGRLRERLRERADSEHEQAFTRLLVVPAMFAYMLWAPHAPDRARLVVLLSAGIFAFGLASALAIIAHILWRPAPNLLRRLVSMAVDVAGVGAGMLVGGTTSTVFFPILLWIILGYGFRFGWPYLFAAAGMSISAFSGVLLLSAD
jgi:two-component system, sensor histidine kinase RpfC